MRTILALHTTSRHFGYAVVKGSQLVAYGTKVLPTSRTIGNRLHRMAIPFVRELVDEHNPDVVVTPRGTRYVSSFKNRFLRALRVDAIRHQLITQSFSRDHIRAALGRFVVDAYPSRDRIMKVLVEWFPQLGPHLPPPRRPWDSIDYWTPMFDAVSLAVTFLHHDA